MATILDGLAARLKAKSMFLSAVEAGEGAAEIRRLRHVVAELSGPLIRLVAAKDEKDAHGETDLYRQLKDGAWEMAREAIGRGGGDGR